MKIGTWNVGHQAGRSFKPGAVDALLHLGCDVVVACEYCPGDRHSTVVTALKEGGMPHVAATVASKANGILIASRMPLLPTDIRSPTLDQYAGIAALCVQVKVDGGGPVILGCRVPWWDKPNNIHLVKEYWGWLETTAKQLQDRAPAIILGDLNVRHESSATRGGEHFRRVLKSGWIRAQPKGASFKGMSAGHQIDHALLTEDCVVRSARLLQEVAAIRLCGDGALSDHAALVVDFAYPGEPADGSVYHDGVASQRC